MDSLITTLQEEVTQLTGLSDETENTLLLSVAGLKHVSQGVVYQLSVNVRNKCSQGLIQREGGGGIPQSPTPHSISAP